MPIPCCEYTACALSEWLTAMTRDNGHGAMANKLDSKIDPSHPTVYQIRIKGHLGRQWTNWFRGLTITLEENGDTLLTGPVVDQAALHGLLKKVRDLGLPLLSVNRVIPAQADALGIKETDQYQ